MVQVVCASCLTANRVQEERLGERPGCGKCHAPLLDGRPVELHEASFDTLVGRTELPVLVDFWASWCGPCRMVAPELQRVAASNAGRYLVVKVNTDALPDLGERFGIRSIPTMAVFDRGREVARTAGARPAADIETFVRQSLFP